MTTTMSVEDASSNLLELLDGLAPGDEVILTRDQKPVARLLRDQPAPMPKPRPGPGLGKGMITYIAPDFDAPLEEMKEYMEISNIVIRSTD